MIEFFQEKLLKLSSFRAWITVAGIIVLVAPSYIGLVEVPLLARIAAAGLAAVAIVCDTVRPFEEAAVEAKREKEVKERGEILKEISDGRRHVPPSAALVLGLMLFAGCGQLPYPNEKDTGLPTESPAESEPTAEPAEDAQDAPPSFAIISGPISVVVTPPGTQAKATCSVEGNGYSWLVLSSDFRPVSVEYVDGRRSVMFAVEAKKRYLLAVTALVDGELSSAQTIYPAEPGPTPPGPDPDPPVPPDPDPPAPPVFPDGRYGLAKKAYDWAQASVAEEDRGQAQSLATVLAAIAADIADGDIDGFAGALTTLKAKFVPFEAGWGKWRDLEVDEFNRLFDAGTMTTVEDFGVALSEISTGLRKL